MIEIIQPLECKRVVRKGGEKAYTTGFPCTECLGNVFHHGECSSNAIVPSLQTGRNPAFFVVFTTNVLKLFPPRKRPAETVTLVPVQDACYDRSGTFWRKRFRMTGFLDLKLSEVQSCASILSVVYFSDGIVHRVPLSLSSEISFFFMYGAHVRSPIAKVVQLYRSMRHRLV